MIGGHARPAQTPERGGERAANRVADRSSERGEVRAPAPEGYLRQTVLLAHGTPFDASAWFRHVADRAVDGLERTTGLGPGVCVAVTRLLHGVGGPVVATVRLDRGDGSVHADLDVATRTDVGPATHLLRRWLDLDADTVQIEDQLRRDPFLATLVDARPGLRIPGTTDTFELAVRAVLGQQVSTAAARTVAGRLVAELAAPGPAGLRLFPSADTLASVPLDVLRGLGLNTGRAATILVLARAVADGLDLSLTADRARARAALLALPGIGPWTADYVALRALGDPDAFPAGDLVLRYALAQLPGGEGAAVDIRAAAVRASAWRPWRGYAAQHLWSAWAARAPSGEPAPSRQGAQPVSDAGEPP